MRLIYVKTQKTFSMRNFRQQNDLGRLLKLRLHPIENFSHYLTSKMKNTRNHFSKHNFFKEILWSKCWEVLRSLLTRCGHLTSPGIPEILQGNPASPCCVSAPYLLLTFSAFRWRSSSREREDACAASSLPTAGRPSASHLANAPSSWSDPGIRKSALKKQSSSLLKLSICCS